MNESSESMEDLLAALQERAKELNCLYDIEEILGDHETEPTDACRRIIRTCPPNRAAATA